MEWRATEKPLTPEVHRDLQDVERKWIDRHTKEKGQRGGGGGRLPRTKFVEEKRKSGVLSFFRRIRKGSETN